MTAPELKYGRRNVAKMIREWDALRQAIRAEGTPMVQSALDQVEEHIDYAYRADLAAAQPAREKPEYCDICRGRTFAETSDGKWWCCVECKSLWLRAAVQPAQVRVKPLEWTTRSGAPTAFGTYIVTCEDHDNVTVWFVLFGGKPLARCGEHRTEDAAKAAAQADYEARILAALEPQPDPRELTVWYGKMPESNGRENWTAILRPKAGDNLNGILDGFCFARSEYPDRVRYEADRMRWIIGELTEKPDILAYDADLHSGYVERPDPRDEVIARLVDALENRLHDPECPCNACEPMLAALAAAKAVQHD